MKNGQGSSLGNFLGTILSYKRGPYVPMSTPYWSLGKRNTDCGSYNGTILVVLLERRGIMSLGGRIHCELPEEF